MHQHDGTNHPTWIMIPVVSIESDHNIFNLYERDNVGPWVHLLEVVYEGLL